MRRTSQGPFVAREAHRRPQSRKDPTTTVGPGGFIRSRPDAFADRPGPIAGGVGDRVDAAHDPLELRLTRMPKSVKFPWLSVDPPEYDGAPSRDRCAAAELFGQRCVEAIPRRSMPVAFRGHRQCGIARPRCTEHDASRGRGVRRCGNARSGPRRRGNRRPAGPGAAFTPISPKIASGSATRLRRA
jgi:hypothetical protein